MEGSSKRPYNAEWPGNTQWALVGPVMYQAQWGIQSLRAGTSSYLCLITKHLARCKNVVGGQQVFVGGVSELRSLASVICLEVITKTSWQHHHLRFSFFCACRCPQRDSGPQILALRWPRNCSALGKTLLVGIWLPLGGRSPLSIKALCPVPHARSTLLI